MSTLLRRAGQGLALVLLTTTITFFLIHAAPGDPFSGLRENPRVTEAMVQAERARYGLDQPLAVQYLRFLGGVARGDLGVSFFYNRPVRELLAEHALRTAALMGIALVLGFAGGIALGALQGARPGGWFDRLTGGAAVLIAGLPDFWLALLVLLVFALTWHVLPAAGLRDPTLSASADALTRVGDLARHMVLPAGTLALLIAATVSRYQRAAILEVLPEPWIRTARAKGVAPGAVVYRHALRNALLPIVTLGGLAVPALLGGAVFVETVFAWPGMGSLAVRAVGERDYPVVVAVVLLAGAMVVAGSLLADLAHAMLDPREQHA